MHSSGVCGISFPVRTSALGLESEVHSGLLRQQTLSFQQGWGLGRGGKRGSWIWGELALADWSLEPQRSGQS